MRFHSWPHSSTVFAVALVGVSLALVGAGCNNSSAPSTEANAPATGASATGGTIRLKGSDTLLQLAQAWAEAFSKVHPEIPVTVTGGGSGVGITALINGQTEIADASRPIEPKEVTEAEKQGIKPTQHTVARDALSIIVNPGNSIKELTLDQLADIYLGKTTNWSQVGGSNLPISASSRESSSGTYVYFKEHVLKKKEYGPKILHMPSNVAIASQVATDAGGIGYVGMGYVSPKIRAISIKKDAASPGVAPTIANVLNHTYPLSRPLFQYTNGEATGNVKVWLDFVLGPQGQKIVAQKEFIPAAEMSATGSSEATSGGDNRASGNAPMSSPPGPASGGNGIAGTNGG